MPKEMGLIIISPSYDISFSYRAFCPDPQHVLIILLYNNQYVLTKHRRRGLEFPGGKVEPGETAEQAAIRETKEETGCTVRIMKEIGQYRIPSIANDFIKSIFLAEVEQIDEQHIFLETESICFFDALTEELLSAPTFSYIMQDGVVHDILQYLHSKSEQPDITLM